MGSDDLPLRVENQPMNPTAPQLATAIAPGPGMAPGGAFAKDNHAEHLVLGHVPDAAGADDLAVLHHRHAVGEVEHVVDVVTDEEDAEALGLGLLGVFAYLCGLRRPQRRRWLIHDEHLGVEMYRPRDGDRLALAAGERDHRLLEAAEVR